MTEASAAPRMDPEPPRWEELFFYSHPAIANRVRALGLRWDAYAAPAAS